MPAQVAKLPRVVPDFSMINPINNTLDIPSGGDIEAYINGGSGVSSGKRIFQLDPNGSYGGDNVITPRMSDWCEIRPGDVTLPAIGTRVNRTSALGFNLPVITAQNSNTGFKFSGATRWRLRCLEIRGAPTAGYNGGDGDSNSLIQTCPDPISGYTDIPAWISITQCRIGGAEETHHGTRNRRVAIMGNATMLEIRDSTIFNINMAGMTYVPQSQSAGAYAGMGKLLIDNCNLWGSTECVAFGGANQYPQLEAEQWCTADTTIRKSHLYRPDSVRGFQGCANGTEWKLGRRTLLEACIIENVYIEFQNGMGMGIWTANQNNNNPFVQTCDFTARYCWFKNCAGLLFATANHATLRGIDCCRLNFEHLIMTGTGVTGQWRTWDADPALADFRMKNCLALNSGETWMVTNYAVFKRMSLLNNILGTNFTGSELFFTSGGNNQLAWNKFNENGDCEFTGNAQLDLTGGSKLVNPGSNTAYASLAAMGFVDSSKVFGMTTKYADLGALVNTTGQGPDMALVQSKLAGVEMPLAEYNLYTT